MASIFYNVWMAPFVTLVPILMVGGAATSIKADQNAPQTSHSCVDQRLAQVEWAIIVVKKNAMKSMVDFGNAVNLVPLCFLYDRSNIRYSMY